MRVVWIGALGLLGFAVPGREADAAAGPPRGAIVVVDLEKVFEKYQKRMDLESVLEERYAELRSDVAASEKDLKGLQEKLELLAPGAEEYRRVQSSVIKLEGELKAKRKQYTDELNKQSQGFFDALLDEVTAEVVALAKREGYAMVLQRGLRIQEKPWVSVLYNDPSLDITDRVTETLNEKYRKSKEESSAAGVEKKEAAR